MTRLVPTIVSDEVPRRCSNLLHTLRKTTHDLRSHFRVWAASRPGRCNRCIQENRYDRFRVTPCRNRDHRVEEFQQESRAGMAGTPFPKNSRQLGQTILSVSNSLTGCCAPGGGRRGERVAKQHEGEPGCRQPVRRARRACCRFASTSAMRDSFAICWRSRRPCGLTPGDSARTSICGGRLRCCTTSTMSAGRILWSTRCRGLGFFGSGDTRRR